MTSEVVVMNRLAVALAADSAATVSNSGSRKIWNSANKLFALSRCHPVGVMVYNGSSILGVPWETIIKMYRVHLDSRSFPHLEQYGRDFVEFLNSHPRLFPREAQRAHFQKRFWRKLSELEEDGRKRFYEALRDADRPVDIEEHFVAAVQDAANELEKLKEMASSEHHEAAVQAEFGDAAGEVLEQFSERAGVPISPEARDLLVRIAVWMVSKEYFGNDYTGIVFAGFGDDEHFPVLQSLRIGGVALGALRCSTPSLEVVSDEQESIVRPFAQSEMVDTFLQGVNPTFRDKIIRSFIGLSVQVPSDVIDQISDLSEQQKKQWKGQLLPNVNKTVMGFLETFDDHFVSNHWKPVHDALIHLPKDELAEVAEALVNLNSFQQRVSMNEETVGGPIDVAVISKGDGLIWIKRKHYFSRELNEHYFNNLRGATGGSHV